jgi:hypothetical protein
VKGRQECTYLDIFMRMKVSSSGVVVVGSVIMQHDKQSDRVFYVFRAYDDKKCDRCFVLLPYHCYMYHEVLFNTTFCRSMVRR